MSAAIEFRDVDILFSARAGPARARRRIARRSRSSMPAGRASEIADGLRRRSSASPARASAIAPGEICVMMGLSGSGKSTLLRAANGLNAVTRGQVLIDGRERADRRGALRRAKTCGALRRERVAMVFQQFGLLPWRTVADNVGLGLELRGEPAAERQRIVAREARARRPVAMGGSRTSASCRAACSSASASRAPSRRTPTSC